MPRSVVTGGAGFLGSHICDYLIGKGHSVVCVDNFITGAEANIAHLKNDAKFTLINQDVTEYISVKGEVDFVFHFASPASPIDYIEFPIQTLKVGSIGTHRTLGLAMEKGARYILASTSEVYGDPLVNPQPESYWGNVNPIGPRGVYDEAKRFAEAMAMAYHRTHNVDTKIVRIFNTYGPRMRKDDGRVVPAFICQALRNEPLPVFGEGSQTRSFCYISDLIRGIYLLAVSDLNEPVNMGNPSEMTILEFAKKVIKCINSKSGIVKKDLPIDDPKIRRPDITRAADELDWKPEVSLDDGLVEIVKWFKKKIGEER
ncbi:MAG: SDR family oxidoreductase [Candidatus Aureabacteria bacterium]|nr:SDR family oxidoreductase [Candidatus Auribacterota bacterium]MCK5160474.1 SDR family oxidoreductase [Candidatus Auribacterota bacterium]MCK5654666.1 SDR family oxidoreductase [Candidatus Auribacterota bacterium]